MILRVETASGTHDIDVGDVSGFTMDRRTEALESAMTAAGLDPTEWHLILGSVDGD